MVPAQRVMQEFLTELFAEYDKQEVEYCVLRNYETLPERLESRDIDLRISAHSRKTNRNIIAGLAKRHGIRIYNHYADERFDQIYLFKRIAPDDFFSLKLDCYDLELYGVTLLSGAQTLRNRVRCRNFFVAGDIHKVLDKWLFVYLVGATLPDKYHLEFRTICNRHREELNRELSSLFGRREGDRLCTHICEQGFSSLPKITKGKLALCLLRAAGKSPLFHVRHVPQFLYYRLKHTLFPKGEFISVSGPDGCGKTTILKEAAEQLRQLFSSSPEAQGHFRPNVLPRIANIAHRTGIIASVDEDYSSPHRGTPSGFAGSLVRFLYYLADYLWGYFKKIRPALVRRELVFYDRYYFDMVADPGRSRIALPLWLRKAALWVLPLPHTAFFIHTPPTTARQRKQELSLEKIEELNAAYLNLATAGRMQHLENDSTAAVAVAKLIDTVIARRRHRLQLDKLWP